MKPKEAIIEMKVVYPVLIRTLKTETYYDVFVPDLELNTEGSSLADAMEMARDAIGAKCITLEDMNLPIPASTALASLTVGEDELATLVDVDLSDYRKRNETRAVKKNCTVPGWLCYEAEQANINFSAVLQEALKARLGIDN
jgi:predicted RNase H-like HicB family nuclease